MPPKRYSTLAVEERSPHILMVTLNRPDNSNALNTQMGHDLLDLFGDLGLDSGDTRCVIITGQGEKAFCAGGDLKERNGMSVEQWQKQHVIFEHAFSALIDCPVPLIAAVNGAAYGGGCEIALCADFIIASQSARFALTETSLGIIPGGGGTQNLSRAVGARRAKQLIFTATPFSAHEAAQWQMVNEVTEAGRLLFRSLELAERIAANGPIATRQAKAAISLGASLDLGAAMRVEVEAYNRTVPSKDREEGVRAFNEKRRPNFRGI